MYVRRDRWETVNPLVLARSPYMTDPGSNTRFEHVFDWFETFDPSTWLTLPATIGFLKNTVHGGYKAFIHRNHVLALAARDAVCQILSVQLSTPDDLLPSMISIPLPDVRQLELHGVIPLQRWLHEKHQIEIPIYAWPAHPKRVMRLSVNLFNTLDESIRLARLVKTFIDEEKDQAWFPSSKITLLTSDRDIIQPCFQIGQGCHKAAHRGIELPVQAATIARSAGAQMPAPRVFRSDVPSPSVQDVFHLALRRVVHAVNTDWQDPPALVFPTVKSQLGQVFSLAA